MIGYVTLGTNDLERAAKFYDAIAAEMGTSRMMEWPGAIAWGTPGGGAGIGLTRPFDGQAASVGNGVMVALEAASREQIHRLHEIALAHVEGRIDFDRDYLRDWSLRLDLQIIFKTIYVGA